MSKCVARPGARSPGRFPDLPALQHLLVGRELVVHIAIMTGRFVLAAAVALTVAAGTLATAARGLPFPGFLTDPWGFYSAASFPGWRTGDACSADAVRPGTRVVDVDGVPLGTSVRGFDTPGGRLTPLLERALAQGRSHAVLTLDVDGRLERRTCAIQTVGRDASWFFFGLYALGAWFALWSGLFVLQVSGRREGARALTAWACAVFVFLLCFFDFHTTRRLTGLFGASSVAVCIGFLWLAWAFPEPPTRLRTASRRVVVALTVAGGVAALLLLGAPWVGVDPSALQRAIPPLAALSIATLAISIVVRHRGASGRRREELRAALWGLAIVPVAACGLLVAGVVAGAAAFHLALPFVVLALPMAIGYALVRRNILGSRVVLSRSMLAMPLLFGSLFLALFGVVVARAVLRQSTFDELVSWLFGGVLFAVVGWMGWRAGERAFFPGGRVFRPSVEQLSDALSDRRTPEEIRAAIEAVVTRWFSVPDVQVVAPGDLHRMPGAATLEAALVAGQTSFLGDEPWARRLLVPMRSLSALRAVLVLGPKPGGALYTTEDLQLLETIAGMGALALHHADDMRELDTLRRVQLEASLDEKRQTLGMMGAEVSHEIAYPLNFFRYLLKAAEGGKALQADDVEIGREEVERLERMAASLKRLSAPSPQLVVVEVVTPVRRAAQLLRERLSEQGTRLSVEIPENAAVLAEPDGLVQLVANLLRNAVQAAGVQGEVGVCFRYEAQGAVLEVRDSGPGVPPELSETLFNPWVTTREGGSGLGLAVTQRIVRSYGWSIEFGRTGSWTWFRVHVPQAGLAQTSAGARRETA